MSIINKLYNKDTGVWLIPYECLHKNEDHYLDLRSVSYVVPTCEVISPANIRSNIYKRWDHILWCIALSVHFSELLKILVLFLFTTSIDCGNRVFSIHEIEQIDFIGILYSWFRMQSDAQSLQPFRCWLWRWRFPYTHELWNEVQTKCCRAFWHHALKIYLFEWYN